MKILAPSFDNGSKIPAKYTCRGEDVSPSLAFSDIPSTAKSLALVVSDPDSPLRTFYHWLIWNIDPNTIATIDDVVPEGAVQGTNDFGRQEYSGPCPQIGFHRYIFRAYALDTMLSLPPGAKIEELEASMSGHIVGQTQTVGVFP